MPPLRFISHLHEARKMLLAVVISVSSGEPDLISYVAGSVTNDEGRGRVWY